MSASGTYSDSVGKIISSDFATPPIDSAVTLPQPGQDNDKAKIDAWLNGNVKAPMSQLPPEPQNIGVVIGGHGLEPAIKNRIVESIPPNRLKIAWPDN